MIAILPRLALLPRGLLIGPDYIRSVRQIYYFLISQLWPEHHDHDPHYGRPWALSSVTWLSDDNPTTTRHEGCLVSSPPHWHTWVLGFNPCFVYSCPICINDAPFRPRTSGPSLLSFPNQGQLYALSCPVSDPIPVLLMRTAP